MDKETQQLNLLAGIVNKTIKIYKTVIKKRELPKEYLLSKKYKLIQWLHQTLFNMYPNKPEFIPIDEHYTDGIISIWYDTEEPPLLELVGTERDDIDTRIKKHTAYYKQLKTTNSLY